MAENKRIYDTAIRQPDIKSHFLYLTTLLNMASKKSSRKVSGLGHRSTLSLQKTQIIINVYDLLPVSDGPSDFA